MFSVDFLVFFAMILKCLGFEMRAEALNFYIAIIGRDEKVSASKNFNQKFKARGR